MPTDMPVYAFTGLNVLPNDGKSFARSEGGLVITSSRVDPYWRGRMTTQPLGVDVPNEHADFLAWMSWAVDLNMRVDFVHPRHRLPVSYTLETWPLSGDASLHSIIDLRTIRVGGLVNGLVLKRGDRLSIVQGDIIAHRWIAADITVSSIISQEIGITPRLPIGVFAPAATVVLKDPKMRFMIVPGSWDAAEQANASPVSFDVEEALR